jgi:ADP-ribose pyrophosphatase YjhB (NUDIX family)
MRSAAQPHIRTVVLCVLRREDSVLVCRDVDRVSGQRWHRPPGGGVEFGERAEQALRREIREELGTEIADPRLLGVIENLFVFEGREGHEIVFVYAATAADPGLYAAEEIGITESDGTRHEAVWLPLSDFDDPRAPVYPPGITALVTRDRA